MSSEEPRPTQTPSSQFVWEEVQAQRARLHELESTVAAHTMILRYDVVLRSGPLVKQLENVVEQVREIKTESATKIQIEEALAAQTRQLKNTAFNKFSRREKILASLVGIFLVGINLTELTIKLTT